MQPFNVVGALRWACGDLCVLGGALTASNACETPALSPAAVSLPGLRATVQPVSDRHPRFGGLVADLTPGGSAAPFARPGDADGGQAASNTAPAPVVAAPQVESRPRRDSLDAELVYAVLVAEVAARRGNLTMAFTHFLHAAQLARDAKMAELAVRAAIGDQDDTGAGRAVALWLELAPESLGAHQIAALLRIKSGDREGALTHLTRVIRLAGADGESGYLLAAGIVGRAGSASERVSLMRALVDLDASNPDAQQALAMVAAGSDENVIAADAARRALELRPGWDTPRLFLVKLLLSEGKRGEARKQLEAFVAATPEDQGLRMLYAQFLVEEKEFSGAREVFATLLEARPKAPDVLFAAGVLSLELDDLDAARGYLTRLYQTGERRDEASFYLGQIEERAAHPDAAIDWYGKTQGENLIDAQIRIAVLRAKAGEVERAREIVQQLRDQIPDDAPMLYLAEAEILDQIDREDLVMQVYNAGLAAFPDDADLLYGRAMYAVKRNRLDLAEPDLRRIIERNPGHADALNALGYTLADRTDRYQEALGYIERALKLKPDEPAILDSVGWVNFKLGNHDVALEFLTKALGAMKDGEIAAHLGEVLWALGRQDEAWAVWDTALKEHPDHVYLKEVIGRHRVTRQDESSQ
ncbi:tetratricopeptide repeat protein [uncultured Lamprocystis sp.]|jgi:tetratricopeptide (TPR) repeat protein|uniref:tetratricopeptide repeat protein n=1 Tax=uncultured Lamprocystis sp. TaxID=543132 RepID=UPI0025ED2BAB|nr:tetratricopeptide repeat protein [uncultured Lamprocystis sp.]